MLCPLCASDSLSAFFCDKRRSFWRCPDCDLIFVPPRFHLSPEDERARYRLHDNTLANAGYIASFSPCIEIIAQHFTLGARILDFGCGEAAALARLLRQRGFHAKGYDPLYGLGDDALRGVYAAIVLWEVIEHVRNPRQELLRIKSLLHQNGKVVIKTQIRSNEIDFASWWYRQDPTHIGFYSCATIEAVATLLGRKIVARDESGLVLLG